MAENVAAEQDEARYWALGMAFVQVLVADLNETLKENGVTDASVRQAICTRATFGIGNFLDQYWLTADGVMTHPLVCFSGRFFDIGDAPSEIGTLLLPSREFEFHAASLAVVKRFFTEQAEQLTGVLTGPVEDE